jgi:hypothetical protein
MSDRMTALLAEGAELAARAEPIRQRLAALDEAISALDAARARRDELAAEHDRRVAQSIADRLGPPDMDPRLNLAEIALRKVADGARAALTLRPEVERQLSEINGQLAANQAEVDEQIWLDYPAAAHSLLAAAEASVREAAKALARVDSCRAAAHQHAHLQTGRDPQSTPAYRAYLQLSGMLDRLNTQPNAVRDFATGRQLLDEVRTGTAELGDISRWLPPRRAAIDGDAHINRGKPEPEPIAVVEAWVNPATDPTANMWRFNPSPGALRAPPASNPPDPVPPTPTPLEPNSENPPLAVIAPDEQTL